MRDGKRLQQDRLHDTEHGGVGADAEPSVSTTTAVNPGEARSVRAASCRSRRASSSHITALIIR